MVVIVVEIAPGHPDEHRTPHNFLWQETTSPQQGDGRFRAISGHSGQQDHKKGQCMQAKPLLYGNGRVEMETETTTTRLHD